MYLRRVLLTIQQCHGRGYTPSICVLRKSSALGSPLVTEKSILTWEHKRTRAPVLQNPAQGGWSRSVSVSGVSELEGHAESKGSISTDLWVEDSLQEARRPTGGEIQDRIPEATPL